MNLNFYDLHKQHGDVFIPVFPPSPEEPPALDQPLVLSCSGGAGAAFLLLGRRDKGWWLHSVLLLVL